jgi:hypothetical protein
LPATDHRDDRGGKIAMVRLRARAGQRA